MDRFKRELNKLRWPWLQPENDDLTCERICALARTLNVSPSEYNDHEDYVFYDTELDLLYFTMKKAAANTLGISVQQLSKVVQVAHVLVDYFRWGGEDYPECGQEFVSPDGVEFVMPMIGEDNNPMYSDFPGLKFLLSSEYQEYEWHSNNKHLIEGLNAILDILEDESIPGEVLDEIFIAFSDCVERYFEHPSILDVCYRILKRAWAA